MFFVSIDYCHASSVLSNLNVPTRTGVTGIAEQSTKTEEADNINKTNKRSIMQTVTPGTGWKVKVHPHNVNVGKLVTVDKTRQEIELYEHNSPLKKTSSFICTTGQVIGDKKIEGDLKTPEGIYFVVRKINGGLDYTLYGNEAYTLNYPNPVDKLRRKTGYGIWIHGRGYNITPLETQGCVAMNNTDLANFGKILQPGIAVALADVVETPIGSETKEELKKKQNTINILKKNVTSWAKEWENRSHKMFEFYDADSYSISQEPFSQFKAQKERLFKQLAWIKNNVSNIQVAEGPGYWVTWFFQDYKAPNLETKGVRRLYWQENDNGNYRIVGMEWIPGLTIDGSVMTASLDDPGGEKTQAEVPLKTEGDSTVIDASNKTPIQTQPEKTISKQTTKNDTEKVVKKEKTQDEQIKEFVEKWRFAWQKADLNSYTKFYAKNAQQGDRKGLASIKAQKASLWKTNKPKKIVFNNIKIKKDKDSIQVEFTQNYKDNSGKGDKGTKILYLKPTKNSFEIIREDWRK
ncbi:L,D-transpeptidase family protein [Desulfovibrio litoralis]|nr:L,D-transpeptidase family protein [Desulfovibrio litoralis]